MDEAQVQRIMNDPDFQSMAKKTGLGMIFTVVVLIVWFGFIYYWWVLIKKCLPRLSALDQ